MIIGKIPNNKPYRVSSDSVWPLRRANGLTWAQDKQLKELLAILTAVFCILEGTAQ